MVAAAMVAAARKPAHCQQHDTENPDGILLLLIKMPMAEYIDIRNPNARTPVLAQELRLRKLMIRLRPSAQPAKPPSGASGNSRRNCSGIRTATHRNRLRLYH